MVFTVFDIETNGLLDTVSKFYCLLYKKIEKGKVIERGMILDPDEAVLFLQKQEYLVGHNIIRYDIPALNILSKYKLDFPLDKTIDTLGLSYGLFAQDSTFKHGLEAWGVRTGIAKIEIKDWENLTLDEYILRCKEDVNINVEVILFFFYILKKLYSSFETVMEYVTYLNMKLDALREQEEVKIWADIQKAEETLAILQEKFDEKTRTLSEIMPKVPSKKTKPKKILTVDGKLSEAGKKWLRLLKERNLPVDTEVIYEKGNPGASEQVKDFLFKYGWQPETYKANKKGEKIPQISLPFGAGLCPSVKKLAKRVPEVMELASYYMLRHRIGLCKGFIEHVDKNGYVFSNAIGFTNTLRLQHTKPIANLPKPKVPYGKEIRGILSVPNKDGEKWVMIGSDISGLEDCTKQHYLYYFDPDYVNDMRVPGFDPHLDIALCGNLVTEDDAERYKYLKKQKEELKDKFVCLEEDKKLLEEVGDVRDIAKKTNFTATYGGGAKKIAESAEKDFAFGKMLSDIYWTRNKAIKQVVTEVSKKIVEIELDYTTSAGVKFGGKMLYLLNPVSKFYYYLKHMKDIFSTLNQGTGSYVFDCWNNNVRRRLKPLGIKVCLQYHDELLVWGPKELEVKMAQAISMGMKDLNEQLKLNVPIANSIDYGLNYAECH